MHWISLFFCSAWYTWFTDETLSWIFSQIIGCSCFCWSMLVYAYSFHCLMNSSRGTYRRIIVQSKHNTQRFCNVLLGINSSLITKRVQTLPHSKDIPFEHSCSTHKWISLWETHFLHPKCWNQPINAKAQLCHQMWIICDTSVFMTSVCHPHLHRQRHFSLTSTRVSRKPSAGGDDSPDNQLCHFNKVIQRVTLTE